jgi:energy-coupling factor transporter ATP-binding protein EcfA2
LRIGRRVRSTVPKRRADDDAVVKEDRAMRLRSVHVREFKSVIDSGAFEVGDVTCLVGKNEAGKTALMQALYRLNPIIQGDGTFDPDDDYPRADVEDYKQDVESGRREPAVVVEALFVLEDSELDPIKDAFGPKALASSEFRLSKGYKDGRTFDVKTSFKAALEHLLKDAQVGPELLKELGECGSATDCATLLKAVDPSEEVNRLKELFVQIGEHGFGHYVYVTYIKPKLPKFVYFDEYYQMRGHENIEALQQRRKDGALRSSDYPMLGLIELARLDLAQLLSPERTQQLVNKLEGAGNHLGKKILKYWSQNKHLQTRFDVRPAKPGDPEGMTSGTNIWAGVYDTRHMVTTNLGTRSRGFVWFFSFLAWYSQIQKRNENVILLLDEPGLSLHAKAQADLLRYFDEELQGVHQLIYTTHSPFMVDPTKFDRVRIVQDLGIDSDKPLSREEDGTKVFIDVLEATEDTLFPLQGALGYDIYQTLFVGPNCLVVEGVSDLLYLQAMSSILERAGRVGLDRRWTITPVGGTDKVPTFVALIGANSELNVATLIDFQKKDRQSIENLYKKKLLKKSHVLTFADFCTADEADVEDMFDPGFYLRLVNGEYATALKAKVRVSDLPSGPRIIKRIEKVLETVPLSGAAFNHYRPARYFSENVGSLEDKLSASTLDRYEEAFKALNKLL